MSKMTVKWCSDGLYFSSEDYMSEILSTGGSVWLDTCTLSKPGYLSHIMRKPVYVICEQRRRRSACICDQRLCFFCCLDSIILTLVIPRIWKLASFEFYLVQTPGRQVFLWHGSIFSSPEPKALRWAYSIARHPLYVLHLSTFSSVISSEADSYQII